MAFGKKKRKGLKTLLLVMVMIVLIGCAGVAGYYFYQNKITSLTKGYEAEIENLQFEAYALKRTVWTSSIAIKAGTVLTTEGMVEGEIKSSLPQSYFLSEEDFGKTLLIDVTPDTPITKSMVFEEIIAKDTREQQLNMILLPSNLGDNQFVDVRIGFPNGEDYIVLTKMKIRGSDLTNNTLWLWMNEKEILTLSSAIVDAYLHKGTKLYTVTYVAPTVQEEALPNYPVNVDVLKVLQSDPNILAEARQGLTDELRKLLDARLNLLTVEDITSVDTGVQKEVNDREIIVDGNTNPADIQEETTTETTTEITKETEEKVTDLQPDTSTEVEGTTDEFY
ncbi:MAG: hypothetical protein H7X94_06000 [Vallitaleaceae bacterium]|nr:hypothetical protein [Vallitaleaceae bacterium]